MPDVGDYNVDPERTPVVRFAVVGGSAIDLTNVAGKSIREVCALQGTPTTGLQPIVNTKRVSLDYVLQGNENLMMVQRITGN